MGQSLQKTFGNTVPSPDHPLLRFTQFTDLYDTWHWDEKAVRKLILDGHLAPIVKGNDSKAGLVGADECPICFLYNNQVTTKNGTMICKFVAIIQIAR